MQRRSNQTSQDDFDTSSSSATSNTHNKNASSTRRRSGRLSLHNEKENLNAMFDEPTTKPSDNNNNNTKGQRVNDFTVDTSHIYQELHPCQNNSRLSDNIINNKSKGSTKHSTSYTHSNDDQPQPTASKSSSKTEVGHKTTKSTRKNAKSTKNSSTDNFIDKSDITNNSTNSLPSPSNSSNIDNIPLFNQLNGLCPTITPKNSVKLTKNVQHRQQKRQFGTATDRDISDDDDEYKPSPASTIKMATEKIITPSSIALRQRVKCNNTHIVGIGDTNLHSLDNNMADTKSNHQENSDLASALPPSENITNTTHVNNGERVKKKKASANINKNATSTNSLDNNYNNNSNNNTDSTLVNNILNTQLTTNTMSIGVPDYDNTLIDYNTNNNTNNNTKNTTNIGLNNNTKNHLEVLTRSMQSARNIDTKSHSNTNNTNNSATHCQVVLNSISQAFIAMSNGNNNNNPNPFFDTPFSQFSDDIWLGISPYNTNIKGSNNSIITIPEKRKLSLALLQYLAMFPSQSQSRSSTPPQYNVTPHYQRHRDVNGQRIVKFDPTMTFIPSERQSPLELILYRANNNIDLDLDSIFTPYIGPNGINVTYESLYGNSKGYNSTDTIHNQHNGNIPMNHNINYNHNNTRSTDLNIFNNNNSNNNNDNNNNDIVGNGNGPSNTATHNTNTTSVRTSTRSRHSSTPTDDNGNIIYAAVSTYVPPQPRRRREELARIAAKNAKLASKNIQREQRESSRQREQKNQKSSDNYIAQNNNHHHNNTINNITTRTTTKNGPFSDIVHTHISENGEFDPQNAICASSNNNNNNLNHHFSEFENISWNNPDPNRERNPKILLPYPNLSPFSPFNTNPHLLNNSNNRNGSSNGSNNRSNSNSQASSRFNSTTSTPIITSSTTANTTKIPSISLPKASMGQNDEFGMVYIGGIAMEEWICLENEYPLLFETLFSHYTVTLYDILTELNEQITDGSDVSDDYTDKNGFIKNNNHTKTKHIAHRNDEKDETIIDKNQHHLDGTNDDKSQITTTTTTTTTATDKSSITITNKDDTPQQSPPLNLPPKPRRPLNRKKASSLFCKRRKPTPKPSPVITSTTVATNGTTTKDIINVNNTTMNDQDGDTDDIDNNPSDKNNHNNNNNNNNLMKRVESQKGNMTSSMNDFDTILTTEDGDMNSDNDDNDNGNITTPLSSRSSSSSNPSSPRSQQWLSYRPHCPAPELLQATITDHTDLTLIRSYWDQYLPPIVDDLMQTQPPTSSSLTAIVYDLVQPLSLIVSEKALDTDNDSHNGVNNIDKLNTKIDHSQGKNETKSAINNNYENGMAKLEKMYEYLKLENPAYVKRDKNFSKMHKYDNSDNINNIDKTIDPNETHSILNPTYPPLEAIVAATIATDGFEVAVRDGDETTQDNDNVNKNAGIVDSQTVKDDSINHSTILFPSYDKPPTTSMIATIQSPQSATTNVTITSSACVIMTSPNGSNHSFQIDSRDNTPKMVNNSISSPDPLIQPLLATSSTHFTADTSNFNNGFNCLSPKTRFNNTSLPLSPRLSCNSSISTNILLPHASNNSSGTFNNTKQINNNDFHGASSDLLYPFTSDTDAVHDSIKDFVIITTNNISLSPRPSIIIRESIQNNGDNNSNNSFSMTDDDPNKPNNSSITLKIVKPYRPSGQTCADPTSAGYIAPINKYIDGLLTQSRVEYFNWVPRPSLQPYLTNLIESNKNNNPELQQLHSHQGISHLGDVEILYKNKINNNNLLKNTPITAPSTGTGMGQNNLVVYEDDCKIVSNTGVISFVPDCYNLNIGELQQKTQSDVSIVTGSRNNTTDMNKNNNKITSQIQSKLLRSTPSSATSTTANVFIPSYPLSSTKEPFPYDYRIFPVSVDQATKEFEDFYYVDPFPRKDTSSHGAILTAPNSTPNSTPFSANNTNMINGFNGAITASVLENLYRSTPSTPIPPHGDDGSVSMGGVNNTITITSTTQSGGGGNGLNHINYKPNNHQTNNKTDLINDTSSTSIHHLSLFTNPNSNNTTNNTKRKGNGISSSRSTCGLSLGTKTNDFNGFTNDLSAYTPLSGSDSAYVQTPLSTTTYTPMSANHPISASSNRTTTLTHPTRRTTRNTTISMKTMMNFASKEQSVGVVFPDSNDTNTNPKHNGESDDNDNNDSGDDSDDGYDYSPLLVNRMDFFNKGESFFVPKIHTLSQMKTTMPRFWKFLELYHQREHALWKASQEVAKLPIGGNNNDDDNNNNDDDDGLTILPNPVKLSLPSLELSPPPQILPLPPMQISPFQNTTTPLSRFGFNLTAPFPQTGRGYFCFVCMHTVTASSYSHANRHVLYFSKDSTSPYKCDSCMGSWSSKSAFLLHLKKDCILPLIALPVDEEELDDISEEEEDSECENGVHTSCGQSDKSSNDCKQHLKSDKSASNRNSCIDSPSLIINNMVTCGSATINQVNDDAFTINNQPQSQSLSSSLNQPEYHDQLYNGDEVFENNWKPGDVYVLPRTRWSKLYLESPPKPLTKSEMLKERLLYHYDNQDDVVNGFKRWDRKRYDNFGNSSTVYGGYGNLIGNNSYQNTNRTAHPSSQTNNNNNRLNNIANNNVNNNHGHVSINKEKSNQTNPQVKPIQFPTPSTGIDHCDTTSNIIQPSSSQSRKGEQDFNLTTPPSISLNIPTNNELITKSNGAITRSIRTCRNTCLPTDDINITTLSTLVPNNLKLIDSVTAIHSNDGSTSDSSCFDKQYNSRNQNKYNTSASHNRNNNHHNDNFDITNNNGTNNNNHHYLNFYPDNSSIEQTKTNLNGMGRDRDRNYVNGINQMTLLTSLSQSPTVMKVAPITDHTSHSNPVSHNNDNHNNNNHLHGNPNTSPSISSNNTTTPSLHNNEDVLLPNMCDSNHDKYTDNNAIGNTQTTILSTTTTNTTNDNSSGNPKKPNVTQKTNPVHEPSTYNGRTTRSKSRR